MHVSWMTPTALTEDGKLVVPTIGKNRRQLKQWRTAAAPEGWTEPDFKDDGWSRAQVPVGVDPWSGGGIEVAGNPGEVNTISLRGKFIVEDPTRVDGVRLSLEFCGGVVVYINGRELTRACLPKGNITSDALAEPYPLEAYVAPDGKTLPEGRFPGELAERYRLRVRSISALSVPSRLLHKGLNVLALEIHRAPIRQVVFRNPPKLHRGRGGPWAHAKLLTVRL